MSANTKPVAGGASASEEVKCSWWGDPHEPEVIRLIARNRWHHGHANLPWRAGFLPQVIKFVRSQVGQGELPVIVTPAGTLTATLEEEFAFTPEGYGAAMADLLRQIEPCLPHGNTKAALLVGADGRKSGTTSVQTALWWEYEGGLLGDAVTLKVHPAPGERLLGTALARRDDQHDPLLGRHRCIRHGVLPLVCHELAIFGGRSEAAVTDEDIIERRELLRDLAVRRSVRCVAALAHSLGMGQTAGAFLDAMRRLAKDEDVTVAISGFVGEGEGLDAVAARFAPLGPRAARVATLLVENV